MSEAEELIERVYEMNEGNESLEEFHDRHGVESLLILTISSAYAATREVDQFASQIRGKTVIEIGAGVGFLALEMAKFANHVYAIEADPAWNWIFTQALYDVKPANLTWIFGAADSVSRWLTGDVAVVYTRSGVDAMERAARRMCPELIRGPILPMDERYSDVPEEIREAAKQFASTISPEKLVSRRGVSAETIRKAEPASHQGDRE